MNALSILRGFARNNAWANHRLLVACARLTRDELHATRTSFFPTLMKTLNHVLIVDWYYVDALTRGGRGASAYANEEPFDDVVALAEAQRASDRALVELVERLGDADLEAIVELDRVDRVQRERAGDVLLHLFEHQIHHRGQAHAMLAGTRVKPPQLDEFFLGEELPLREAELRELGLPLA